MNEQKPGGKAGSILRGVFAVVGGSIAIAITSFAANYLIEIAYPEVFLPGGAKSNPAALMMILVYSIVFSGLGGYVTARLAPNAPMKHVIALSVLQLVGGIAAAIKAGDMLPHWFSVSAVILPIPAMMLGGFLKSRTSGPGRERSESAGARLSHRQ